MTAEMVEPFLEGKTLDEAMEKKKIYLLDLMYLADIECTANRKVHTSIGNAYNWLTLFF